jgi:hypothetical protein
MNDATTTPCPSCGNPFAASQRGRPKAYCSARCRWKAFRLRVGTDRTSATAQGVPENSANSELFSFERTAPALWRVTAGDRHIATLLNRGWPIGSEDWVVLVGSKSTAAGSLEEAKALASSGWGKTR